MYIIPGALCNVTTTRVPFCWPIILQVFTSCVNHIDNYDKFGISNIIIWCQKEKQKRKSNPVLAMAADAIVAMICLHWHCNNLWNCCVHLHWCQRYLWQSCWCGYCSQYMHCRANGTLLYQGHHFLRQRCCITPMFHQSGCILQNIELVWRPQPNYISYPTRKSMDVMLIELGPTNLICWAHSGIFCKVILNCVGNFTLIHTNER